MKLLEMFARAQDAVPKSTVREIVFIVLRKWPTVRHFSEEMLQELITEL